MSQLLEIELPDEVLLGLQTDRESLAKELRLAAAVKWYEMGTMTQGKAAELAGLSRAGFIAALNRYGVSPAQETGDEALRSIAELSK
jgi:predicted HTH domain antitoxin